MLISQSEYARRRGVSRQYVSRLVKQGVIVLENGKVNPVRADAALEARRDPARAPGRKTIKTGAQRVATARSRRIRIGGGHKASRVRRRRSAEDAPEDPHQERA